MPVLAAHVETATTNTGPVRQRNTEVTGIANHMVEQFGAARPGISAEQESKMRAVD
jgi:hypothetical protein